MISYEKAIITLKTFIEWRQSDGNGTVKHPNQRDLDEALRLSVDILRKVVNGEKPSDPAQIRFESLTQMIERYILDNR